MRGRKSAIYGEITDQSTGNGAPVIVEELTQPELRAGYTPEKLDRAISASIHTTEAALGLIQQYGPSLAKMLEAVQNHLDGALRGVIIATDGEPPPGIPDSYKNLVMMADDMGRIMERIAKIVQAANKGIDDLTRLRMFVVGGDTDDGGLADKGENELRRMILEAAKGFQAPESV